MKKFFLIILILTSCSSIDNRGDFDVTNDMTFLEFEKKLKRYIKLNTYPKIED